MNVYLSGSAISTSNISFNQTFQVKFYKYNQEGNLAYEYNPLHNLRVMETTVSHKKGELVDFDTNLLQFSLHHPVQIECQPSYDGSVNLILNDDINSPKLINTRFTCLENNTYKIIERYKNNNTNIYRNDSVTFDLDTSLFKRITKIPTVQFMGLVPGGCNKVGNYNFYFKLADVDGNETDFIAESGTVSCFIGNDPQSIRGGLYDEDSQKMIKLVLSNIDSAYDYVKVYFTRTTASSEGISVDYAYKIDRDFVIKSTVCEITISGYDDVLEISKDEINSQYFLASTAKTQCQCQNRLFLGNLSKPEIPYKELRDLALRFCPTIVSNYNIGYVDENYKDSTGGYEYYNAWNIYYKLGYWPGEIYRFGVVFIMSDYSLSPAFNIRGINNLGSSTQYTNIPLYLNGSRNYIEIDESNYLLNYETLENVKGVIRVAEEFNPITTNSVKPLGLNFSLTTDLITEIKKYCRGFFIVRQKRIPTILAQALMINLDQSSYLPCINDKNGPFLESFIDKNRLLTHDFDKHLTYSSNVKPQAAICPEAELKTPYYNQLFTGAEFTVTKAPNQPSNILTATAFDSRYFTISGYNTNTDTIKALEGVKITLVEAGTKMTTSGTHKFSSRAGAAEEAWRLSYANKTNVNTGATNVVRGDFGTYLGIEDYSQYGDIINIRTPNYNAAKMDKYFEIRYTDESPFMAVSDRIDLAEQSVGFNFECYRGDCYVGNFTHRMHYNFQDPEAPTNDIIVNEETWKDNYEIDDKEKNENINRGDVSAVQRGHWVTFRCMASINISLRDIDATNYNEMGITSRPRAFHPLYEVSWTGENKIPESNKYNTGLSNTLSMRYNYIMPNVPYLKNEFDNRILYSDIFVNDAFKNGYRVFKSTDFQDYTKEYGSIVSLQGFGSNIICVFEHGVALIPVNERVLSGNGDGGNVFINTNKVLPLNPKMLSTNFGSTWIESIYLTNNFVYGVDTVAKKIWRTDGLNFEVISDFKVQQFLNDYITLKEREKTPIIGIRNVKTHFNAFKRDVMFTFYDNLYGVEENVWNLCFNEILGKWITYYSWVPSYSGNIDNIFFSFDRDTSKAIAKLGITGKQYSISGIDTELSGDGIILDNVLISGAGLVGHFDIVNRVLKDNIQSLTSSTQIFTYSLKEESKYFYIENNNLYARAGYPKDRVIYLDIYCDLNSVELSKDPNIAQYLNGWKDYIEINRGQFSDTIAVVDNNYFSAKDSDGHLINLTTDFWKHGKAGIIDVQEELKPCFWYGKQHPFEFEFVVNETPGVHKIFENLEIISNKAEPESFHYQVVGDVYSFSNDKANMYYRQEATKQLYQNLGSNILYNRNYTKITPTQNPVSTIFPLYYERIDTYDKIYDNYQAKQSSFNKDYQNLTGTEIVYDKNLNEYAVVSHSKGCDLNRVGRLRGNMQYREDCWRVEIRPINFVQKNESNWTVPPIQLNNIPTDIEKDEISSEDLPNDYDITDISLPVDGWSSRKETRIRDKYLKIKVRYSGKDKVIISALKTLYNISYA